VKFFGIDVNETTSVVTPFELVRPEWLMVVDKKPLTDGGYYFTAWWEHAQCPFVKMSASADSPEEAVKELESSLRIYGAVIAELGPSSEGVK
jgi:hypothetical protein